MKSKSIYLFFTLFFTFLIYSQQSTNKEISTENLIIENIPEIPKELAQQVKKYSESRGAYLTAVHPKTGEIIIRTRFSSTSQLHYVTQALGMRKQITFYDEPVNNAIFEPLNGDYIIFSKDIGGNEFGQYYKFDLKTYESKLLTDGGRSQNKNLTFRKDGSGVYFTSTKRNGKDRDIYFMDPNNPISEKLILKVESGNWGISDISKDDKQLLLNEYVSSNESYIWLLDIETGKLSEVTNRKKANIVHENAIFTNQPNEIWLISDKENEFTRLAKMNIDSKKTNYFDLKTPWGVEDFILSEDKKSLIFITNEAGINKMYLMNTENTNYEEVKNVPIGLIYNGSFTSDNNSFFFTLSTSKSSADVYKLNLKNGEVEQWTKSELGGIQDSDISLPKIVEWDSFDKLKISGFYYPASKKFTGKRPVLISIHGGPANQSMASFIGSFNYFTNELGVAILSPNVRGSSGFGKTFLTKDNGLLREDSVKDIGALLDWIALQPDLDKDRIMIMGASYGGYMSLATAYHYADRIKCSIDIVGISNFNTFLKNTEEYRRDDRRAEYGDERNPKMADFFEKIAPLNHVDKIKKPMFIIQGTNDPRVPVSEATQMRDKLKKQGNVVWYLEAKNEGHGFKIKENVDYQLMSIILFAQKYLL
jgi:dipeptidyl aminopeptidase/acylaminoacyl peptidase